MTKLFFVFSFLFSSLAYGGHDLLDSRGFRGTYKSHCKCKTGASAANDTDLTDSRGFRGFTSSYNQKPMMAPTPKKVMMSKTTTTPMKRETFATLDVPFAVNSTAVAGQWQGKIVSFLKTLEGKTYSAVELKGFSDPTGNPTYNEKLSMKRAQAVETIIQNKSAKTHDLKVVGAGVRNDTTAAEARVVEIRVLK